MKMKKFINEPENLTEELLEGLALANPEMLKIEDNHLVVNRKLETADRVTIVTMIDISVIGDIFAAPGPQACAEALRRADRGKGVVYIVLNHAGDMLSGNMAMKMIRQDDIRVMKVVTQEDISSVPRSEADDRRGLVGCVPVYKMAGAAAAKGESLEKVAEVAQRVADNMATLAVALRGATHPVTGAKLASLADDEMEIGMGQHGEGGGGRTAVKTADETAQIMLDALIKDLEIQQGEKVLLLING